MRKLVLATMLLTMGLAGTAMAAVDMELAFSPDTAAPGDAVTLFTSIANMGDADEVVPFTVTITYGEFIIGPVEGSMALAAGQELTNEYTFLVPALPYGGDLVIEVSATTADGVTTTASATLTIVVEGTLDSNPTGDLTRIATDMAKSFGGDEDAIESFSRIKAEFR